MKAARLAKLLWGLRTMLYRMPQKLIKYFVGIMDQGIRSHTGHKVQVIIFEWFGTVELIPEGTKLCPQCSVREHECHKICQCEAWSFLMSVCLKKGNRAHNMLQSLPWKIIYKNSPKDIYKFISAKKKGIFWKLMPIFWLREDTADKGKLNLSVHNSSCEQSSLAASCSGNGYCSCFCGLRGAQKPMLRS